MERRNGHSANSHDGALTNGSGNGSSRASLPLDWEHLARSTAHPLRVSILEILSMDGGRTLSPSDLSRELQIPLSNTNYHVTELAKAKLIELARQRQVRGATEHFYRVPVSENEATGKLEKRALSPRPTAATPAHADQRSP